MFLFVRLLSGALVKALFFSAIAFPLYAEASESWCMGYYTGSSIFNTQWRQQGDQNNRLNATGSTTWPTTRYLSRYWSTQKDGATITVYSMALPEQVSVAGNKILTLSAPNNKLRIPGAPWFGYQLHTTAENCVSTGGMWISRNAKITAGSIDMYLTGVGLPSGNYSVRIPYVLAWGTSQNLGVGQIFSKIWETGNVGVTDHTGEFDVSFTINNKCDITDISTIILNHGELTPGSAIANKSTSVRRVNCSAPTTIRFTLSPQVVPLWNGLESRLKVVDATGNAAETLLVNGSVDFKVESTLNKVSNIAEGEFLGASVLVIEYD